MPNILFWAISFGIAFYVFAALISLIYSARMRHCRKTRRKR